MIKKQIRQIALLLTASLIINTGALPIQAAEQTESVSQNITESATEAVDPAQQESEVSTDEVEISPDETATTPTETEESVDTADGENSVTEEENEISVQPETGFSDGDDFGADATEEDAAQNAIQQYLSMPVLDDRSMSLKWWYVITGKVTASDFLIKEDGSSELVFPDSISIYSARDLVLLSYVNPESYAADTVTLSTDAGTEFDLTATIILNEGTEEETVLNYQGLGSMEHPFCGIISYGSDSEGISFALNKSLFLGLSSEAKFLDQYGQPNTVYLMSKAQTAFDGLFAQYVFGKIGVTAEWNICLGNPEQKDGEIYCLPSLFGTLYADTNIKLSLTDNSNLTPSDNGYLCTAMYDNATLEVENTIREISVPVVGELSEEAVLTVQDSAEETQDTEDTSKKTLEETDFDELVEYYKTLPVIPGEMPLEWWFVISDRLDELKDYLKWKTGQSEENAGESNIATFAENDGENEASDVPTYVLGDINKASDLICLSNTAAEDYQKITITITASSDAYDLTQSVVNNGTSVKFIGIGSKAFPFAGTFQYKEGSQNTYLTLNHSMFNALSTVAIVNNINLACAVKSTDNVSGLLANEIVAGTEKTLLEVNVGLKKTDAEGDTWILPALISSIGTNAKVKLTASTTGDLPKIAAQGFFCDSMGKSANLTVNYPKIPEFDTSKDKVGGLVGSMGERASLNIADSEADITIKVATTGNHAGGLVGSMEDAAVLEVNVNSLTVDHVSASTDNGSCVGGLAAIAKNPVFKFNTLTKISAVSFTGTESDKAHLTGYFVGGLVGKMECTNASYNPNVLPVSGLKLKGNDCGGLFGELDNESDTVMIPKKEDGNLVDDITLSCTATNYITQSAGGLIGWYNPKKNECGLIASGIRVKISSDGFGYVGGLIGSSTGSGVTGHHDIDLKDSTVEITKSESSNNLGGLVGSIRECTAYLELSGTVTNTVHNAQTFGGLVAYADDHGHVINVGSATLSNSHIYATNTAGGLVGKMDSGVLYITEKPELNEKPDESDMSKIPADTRGWILGNRGNVLVCTTATEWLTRTNDQDTNDTGMWGQVLQLDQFEKDLVTLNENHTCALRALPLSGGNGYTISSVTDFAAVALRMQLNEKGLLVFGERDIDSTSDVKLSFSNDISLEKTGLTGLTRDTATTYGTGTSSSTERHNITITGNGKTITLPKNIVYTTKSSHNLEGLIAEVNNLTMTDLTIDGNPQVKSLSIEAECGIANDVYGAIELTNITSSVHWTDIALDKSSTISGMVTRLANKDKDVTFTNCKWDGSIETKFNGDDQRSTGGFIGYGSAENITFKNCSVSGTIARATAKTANVGGLIAVLNQANKLTIDTLTVNNTIIAENATIETGGLLGYQWISESVNILGVNVSGATLNAPKARFGGLVYSGSGYWQIEKNGITFGGNKTNLNNFSGISSEDRTSGLILADGFLDRKGLYLEVLYNGYQIETGAVSVSNTFDYFDELVGKSINTQSDGTITSGIVSIATSDSMNGETHEIDQKSCNTYQDQTKTGGYKNLNTRYYYNLDLFRKASESDSNGEINTSAKMVLWSAYNSCALNLQKYFKCWDTWQITGKDIDLTGYSFYPVPFDGKTSISGANITFDFEQLEQIEENNKKPSDTKCQHAGMHTGIFTSAINNSESTNTSNMQLTIKDLTLAGTVGGLNNTYGTIVRGNVQGKNAEHIIMLEIDTVNLNGIRVYNADTQNSSGSYIIAPLLIHSIGSYTTMNLKGVKTTKNSYMETGTTSIKAASSLIGDVGSDNAAEIKLNFSNMMLAESGNKEAICNIFTHALFLESFKYQGGTCQGTYNFSFADDYTLGREIQNTSSGRNQGKQYWFFGEDGENNEIYKKLGLSGNKSTAFQEYPRYVYNVEDNSTFHELDINLPAVDLLDGCGTYSHPYEIKTPGQFKALAQFLKGDPSDGWQVQVTDSVLTSGSFADQNGHSSSDNTDDIYKYASSTKMWNSQSEQSTIKESNDVRNYLRNAYYKVTEDITLKNWSGLGGSTSDQRFRGVIVGDSADRKITINGVNDPQFGGLIAFSSGSVVKNLSIEYSGSITVGLVKDAIPNSTGNASFFGGVVGWCIGGDTVIDNVSVDYKQATIAAVSNLTAVGGYVGLVGGASNQGGGGVVFCGDKINSTLNQNKPDKYYQNPYVGRVLDGYAISEEKINNGDDNYTIPSFESAALEINAESATITVGDANGLWLLSAMENSRHGAAYSNGKPRAGDYSRVGQAVNGKNLEDEKKENYYKETDFYLWKKFNVTTAISDIEKKNITLNITDNCDMRSLGNGFRGIGVSQGKMKAGTTDEAQSSYSLNEDFLKFTTINGNNKTITLEQKRIDVTDESTVWASLGVGLFPILRCTTSMQIEKLKLEGETQLNAGYTLTTSKDFLFSNERTRIGVGMLAGGVLDGTGSGSIRIDNVTVEGASVEANVPFAGGLIGYCGAKFSGQNSLTKITISNCNVSKINVEGKTNIGGLIGFIWAKDVIVNQFNGTTVTISAGGDYVNLDKSKDWKQNYSNGIGGMFGVVYDGQLQIDNVSLNTLSITNKNATSSTDIGFGGLVGATNAPEKSKGHMKNIKMCGNIIITDEKAHVSTGGLIGYLADMYFGDWETSDSKESSFAISGVKIGCEENSSVNLRGFQVGGLIGMLKDGKVTLNIGSETSDGSVKIGTFVASKRSVTISGNSFSSNNNKTSLSGVIGITCNNPTVNIKNLYLSGINIGDAYYTSLVLAKNAKANSSLNIQNMEATNCNVTGKTAGQSGFLYGCSDTANKNLLVNGYNIMLQECSIFDKAGSLFGGNNTTGTVQLVAVSAVSCNGTAKDFSSVKSDSYVIRANYTGTKENRNENSDDPWVPINPQASGSLKDKVDSVTITGDGTAFMNKMAVASKIALDTQLENAPNSETYYNVFNAGGYYTNAGVSQPSISTYSVAGGNTGTDQSGDSSGTGTAQVSQPDDFPVLLLPAVSKSEVNAAIYNYISLLTNYNTEEKAPSLKGKLQEPGITATTYKWDGSQFRKLTETEGSCSLTIGSDGTISVTAGCYDNTKNQFTLLDVPFKDPTGEENTYHLYIPVVVQKLLEYRFYAAASVGTNYSTSHYDELKNQVLASHEEQVTTLLAFEYKRTRQEWQAAIDNGENLLWNFDKSIKITTESSDKLPNGTKLTLVDRNNRNKAYFAEYIDSDTLDFSNFSGYQKVYLCDGLTLEASPFDEEAESTDGKVLYVELPSASSKEATLRIGDKYYRPAKTTDTTADKYNVVVKGDKNEEFLLKEQFYLTIQTPKDESSNAFVNIRIECGNNLKNTTSTDMLPNKRINYSDNVRVFTRNGSENRIIIGDFFEDKVTVASVSSGELVSEDQNSIALEIESQISFVDETWFNHYKDYANGTKLYHRFDLQLKQWETAETSKAVNFAEGTIMNVKYYKNGQIVSGGGTERLSEKAVVGLEFPEAIGFDGVKKESLSITLKAEVKLTYDAGGILEQFIERSNPQEREGLQFCAYSHLAYSEDALNRSSVSAFDDTNAMRFYRNNPQAATLLYNSDGTDEHARMDQLGINGLVNEKAKISSYAYYTVSELSAAAAATKLKYSFKLLRKNNEGEYEEVSNDAAKFYSIDDITVKWLDSSQTEQSVSVSANSSASGEINLNGGLNPSKSIEFDIPLQIKTGSSFENSNGIYSNYQFELTVSLYNNEIGINGSTASDYIIYTNAKIVTSLIE